MKVLIPFFVFLILLYATEAHADNNQYTYENMVKDIQDIKSQHGDLIQISTIGRSELGREIISVKIGKGREKILLIGSHHAREWITSLFLMRIIKDYADAYETKETIGVYSPSILDDISIVFVPMLNPDGVTIQQNGIKGLYLAQKVKLWSMNHFSFSFDRWKANALGIDLNRQYPADWDQLKKIPAWPSYKQYRGDQPVQAKEVRALVQFTKEQNPLLALAYHTSGREIYWYYRTKKEHVARDYHFAEQISLLTGYKLTFPERDAVGGGFTDWFITKFRRPGYTIEMCESVSETNPPISCFNKEWEPNKQVPIMLLYEIMKKGKSGILHNDDK